ncbi:MAG: AraC family transcriptional regulator [Clostridiales bacterium]|nr:AraC family transcriptional regulator [Clostridiales bacterium]
MDAFFELSRDYDNAFYCLPFSNNMVDPHFHSNLELAYVHKGEIEVTVNEEKMLLTPGCAAVANSFDVHAYRTPDGSASEITVLLIPIDMVSQFRPLLQSRQFRSAFLTESAAGREVGHAIQRLYHYNATYHSMAAAGYLYTILGLFADTVGLIRREQTEDSASLVRQVLVYLEQHYLDPLTIEEVAKRHGYNRYYFSRLFNARIGCGFNQHLNNLRARHAARLIRSTNASLEDICFQSGFGSVRTFTRAFQSFYQVSPAAYKRQKKAGLGADVEMDMGGWRAPRPAVSEEDEEG